MKCHSEMSADMWSSVCSTVSTDTYSNPILCEEFTCSRAMSLMALPDFFKLSQQTVGPGRGYRGRVP